MSNTPKQEEKWLTELPEGYFEIFTRFFEDVKNRGGEMPNLEIPMVALMCFIFPEPPGTSEVFDNLRAASVDVAIRKITEYLDVVQLVYQGLPKEHLDLLRAAAHYRGPEAGAVQQY